MAITIPDKLAEKLERQALAAGFPDSLTYLQSLSERNSLSRDVFLSVERQIAEILKSRLYESPQHDWKVILDEKAVNDLRGMLLKLEVYFGPDSTERQIKSMGKIEAAPAETQPRRRKVLREKGEGEDKVTARRQFFETADRLQTCVKDVDPDELQALIDGAIAEVAAERR